MEGGAVGEGRLAPILHGPQPVHLLQHVHHMAEHAHSVLSLHRIGAGLVSAQQAG